MTRTRNQNEGRVARMALVVLVTVATLVGSTGCIPTLGFNPTSLIQSVIGNRLDAMEWAADGWDDYIMQ